MIELKPCPFRIHGERTASLTVKGEYYYNETFMPCMQKACACFHVDRGDAYCDRGGAYMKLGSMEQEGKRMRATTLKDLLELMIVQCKDCKHRPLNKDDPNFWKWYDEDTRCPWFCADTYYLVVPPDDFFCAYGERKDD